jgi:predicted nucleotidyltransferase
MRADTILEKITEELKADKHTIGIFVHGSYAQGRMHADSDLDVMCVTDADWFSKEIRIVDGMEVEIQRMPEVKIVSDLRGRYPTNHNYYMNILTSSRILFDKTGRLKEIVEEAHRIKQAGPPPANEVEILMGRSFFRHRMAEVKRHLARPETRALSRVMMDLMFNHAVFALCKSHRMWSTKLDRMLIDYERDAPEFHRLCMNYLAAEDLQERFEWLERMVDMVMEPNGWGDSIEYRTPRIAVFSDGKIRSGFLF